MDRMERKEHWEHIYRTKSPKEVSWTQDRPRISLDLIQQLQLDKSAAIIDVGGGDSKLVDYLLEEGFGDLTVLDISAKAIEKAQNRLSAKADKINWIVSDVTQYKPQRRYTLWHDRATFHFLTDKKQITRYKNMVEKAVSKYLILATFSKRGPDHCSGLATQQYDAQSLADIFKDRFSKLHCLERDHLTPFQTEQNFLYFLFKRKN